MSVFLSSAFGALRTQSLQWLRTPPAAFSNVRTLLARLSPREQQFVAGAGVALAVVLLFVLVVDPLWETRDRLRARVVAKERELEEVHTLHRIYEVLRRELQDSGRAAKETPVSAFAFLEGVATGTLGREKLAAINPIGRENRNGVEQETIELKLTDVSLQQVVEFLHKIETASLTLRCSQLSIKKRYKDPYSFDVTLTALASTAR